MTKVTKTANPPLVHFIVAMNRRSTASFRLSVQYNLLVLLQRLEFVPDRDSELFAAVPASAAVFVLRGAEEGGEPYVSKTSNLRRRLQRLLGAAKGQTRKLNLRDRVRWVEWTADRLGL